MREAKQNRKIELLADGLINEIAAGEVIERPSSVIKELVENAIDAGATAITVEIKEGGISYIRVADNGCGISEDQVKTAFLRHATSKIYSMEELERVLTLGFRGEALSSIAAVSQLEITTKTEDSQTGTNLEIHGGKIAKQLSVAALTGTTIVVKNLFYNVPARRKFLKRVSAESGYVSDMVNKIALGHPQIAIKFINNDTTILQTPGTDDLNIAAYHVYGKDIATNMLPLEHKGDGFALTGLIGRPEFSRSNRSYENFYINGRFVKSTVLRSAVEAAYKTRLPAGRFPVFILMLEIDPTTVDVNVHPTKLEVRFEDEDKIYSFVQTAVTKAFEGQNLIPKTTLADVKKAFALPADIINKLNNPGALSAATLNEKANLVETERPVASKQPMQKSLADLVYGEAETPIEKPKVNDVKPTEKPLVSEKIFSNYKIVGQIFKTYWLVEQDDEIYLIDQHAAHERKLYEEVMQKLTSGETVPQTLFEPLIINVSPSEAQIIADNLETIMRFGIEVEEFGRNVFAVRAVPYIFNSPASSKFFMDIVDLLKDGKLETMYEAKLAQVATIACKAAVKANDKLSFVEAKALIESLLSLDNPFTCPHGRPTIVKISKYEIEKEFRRV